MKRMNSGLAIAVSGVLSALMACLGLYCAPFGINDPHSSSGFFTLCLYFFIQTLLCAFSIRFDGATERTLPSYLAHGINKLCAVVSLITFAAPHPQFTGVVLWVGVSILLLTSGVKDLCHVGYSVWGNVKNWWEDRVQALHHFRMTFGNDPAQSQREQELNDELDQFRLGLGLTTKKEQQEMALKSQDEDALMADLAGFLTGTDSTGKK